MAIDVQAVRCTLGRSLIQLELGDGNDRAAAGSGTFIAGDGGSGDDVLGVAAGAIAVAWQGGEGDDTLTGLGALSGGPGNDTIDGGDGGDIIDGGEGNDVLRGGGALDTVIGGPGDDRIEGGAGSDVHDAGPGMDVVAGGPGDDLFFDSSTDLAADAYDGGPGDSDKVAYSGADSVTVNLAADQGGRAGEADAIRAIEDATGGSGDDKLFGDAEPNLLDGSSGDDMVRGNGGGDAVDGGAGRDAVDGGAGPDQVIVDRLDASYRCGAGNDEIVLRAVRVVAPLDCEVAALGDPDVRDSNPTDPDELWELGAHPTSVRGSMLTWRLPCPKFRCYRSIDVTGPGRRRLATFRSRRGVVARLTLTSAGKRALAGGRPVRVTVTFRFKSFSQAFSTLLRGSG